MAKVSKTQTATSFQGKEIQLTAEQIEAGVVLAERNGNIRTFTKSTWEALPANKDNWKARTSAPKEPESKDTDSGDKGAKDPNGPKAEIGKKGDAAAPKGKGSKAAKGAKEPEADPNAKSEEDQRKDAVALYKESFEGEEPGDDLTTEMILEAVESGKKGGKE
jgi:hypothetical protein